MKCGVVASSISNYDVFTGNMGEHFASNQNPMCSLLNSSRSIQIAPFLGLHVERDNSGVKLIIHVELENQSLIRLRMIQEP